MTRFSSHYADRLKGTIERVFTVLSDLRANRCEELNNYSGRMTRTKYDACRCFYAEAAKGPFGSPPARRGLFASAGGGTELLTSPQYLPAQDERMGTLRLLLALSVAYGHLAKPLSFPTSDVAVQSFFVISGFYMALVLNEKYGPGSYWLFVSNRLLRLWPAYVVVLILSLAIAGNWQPIFALDWSDIAFFVGSQILIVGQDLYLFLFVSNGTLAFTAHYTDVSTPLYTFAPIPQAWTLGLEIYFYLLAPFLVRRGPSFIAMVIAASVVLRMLLQWAFGLSGQPWSFRFFPSEIALFMAGSLGYYVYASKHAAQRKLAKTLLSLAAASLFVALAINRWDGISRLASLSLLALVIVGVPRLFEMTKSIAWDKYIGELSYPLYICHFLFGWMMMPSTFAGAYLALLLSLAASVALYHLIDRPVDAWRQTRLRKRERAMAIGQLIPSV
jgi:peptidoglycan/LPS O-acetylase OafA/YrhL